MFFSIRKSISHIKKKYRGAALLIFVMQKDFCSI